MSAPNPSERLNAYLNVRDIRDVDHLNQVPHKDIYEPFPSDKDEQNAAFIDMLRNAMNYNNLRAENARRSRKQGLWSLPEIRANFLDFLMGKSPTGHGSIDEDSVLRIENTYSEDHQKDSRMPDDMEYIPTPVYNATVEALLRLLRARSTGATQERKV